MTEKVESVAEVAGRWLCGPPPAGATDPCLAFLANQHRFSHFIGGIFRVAKRMDATLEDLFPGEIRSGLHRYEEVVKQDKDLIAELVVNRAVDDFLTYVAHLLRLLFETRPEIVQTTVQVRLIDILRLPDRESVIQHAIDEYVQKMTFQSLGELYKDLKTKTGFQLFESPAGLNAAKEAVAIRNVLVHNNGIVNSGLARSVRRYDGRVGERVVDFNPLDLQGMLVIAAVDIDQRAKSKWSLPAGTQKVPHLCHRFDAHRDKAKPRAASGEDDSLAPDCERCHARTLQCEVCKGVGETWGPVINMTCTECGGTGRVCAADGKYWKLGGP